VTLTLTQTLDRYFAAQNAHDAEAMVACFAPNAEVRDEGRDHVGRVEIRRWKEETIAKYGISIKPLRRNEQDGLTVVVARVTGNFPGSPAELTYEFGFAPDGLIRTLRIH
jgi:ketosteroid isomerase-like protein